MTARRSVKASKRHAQIVGVIASRSDLDCALRMARPPDLFEIRLDHMLGCLDELEEKMSILPAPLIITARHPAEGGANNLPVKQRRELLLRFLPRAQYVDLELRSAKSLRSVLDAARKKNIKRIISFHDFKSTPPLHALIAKARAAKSHRADIFKVATRTGTPVELQRLLDFAANEHVAGPGEAGQLLQQQLRAGRGQARRRSWATQLIDPIGCPLGAKRVDLALSVMGIGKLGRKSRRELMRRGSVLNYASVGPARIAGQPSLSEIRRWAPGTP